jgi:hypothetical protein
MTYEVSLPDLEGMDNYLFILSNIGISDITLNTVKGQNINTFGTRSYTLESGVTKHCVSNGIDRIIIY